MDALHQRRLQQEVLRGEVQSLSAASSLSIQRSQ
jgi:hypothetical protein